MREAWRGMRQSYVFRGGLVLLAIMVGASAQADELPLRKAGLWEMKMVR